MAKFEIAFKITMGHEGGYANDPDDNGGETYAGIARKFWPTWAGWGIIDAIKVNQGRTAVVINQHAKASLVLNNLIAGFYKVNFWNTNNLDLVNSQAIANELFDIAVNMGVKIAAKMLQESLNLCNKNRMSYPDIEVDGIVGTVETLPILNSKANQAAILNTINMLQGERYLDIMRSNKSQEKFWPSWLSRVIVNGTHA